MFREQVLRLLVKAGLKEQQVADLLEVPPDPALGDLALPCFKLAPVLKKDPSAIATELAAKIKPAGLVKEVRAVGPYLNFVLDPAKFAKQTLSKIWVERSKYGTGKKKAERVMIEGFGQPNTHKAFHVGHLRNVCLSESLSNLLQFAGYKVIRANYYGDVGTHVAKWIWFFKKFYKGAIPKKNISRWLAEIYAKANKYVAEHPRAEEEIAEILRALEQGDKTLIKIWKRTRELSLKEFKRIYKLLGVKFDVEFFESEVEKPGKAIALELLKKGIAERSEGAIIVNLEKYGLGAFLILRSDRTALYSTKDLALAKLKFEKYKINKSIYVVDIRQSLYLNQLFKTLELAGFKQAKSCYHLSYGFVTVEGAKMASRTGELVLFEDLYNAIFERALKEVQARGTKGKKAEKIAHKIALAAIKFGMLKFSPDVNIDFNWERALQFEGDTGPYLQYSLVRAKRIIEKVGRPSSKVKFNLLNKKEEIALIKLLAKFPQLIKESATTYRTHTIANYALELANTFNSFYESCSVIRATNKEVQKARLLLVWAFAQVLKNALGLLGVEEVELM